MNPARSRVANESPVARTGKRVGGVVALLLHRAFGSRARGRFGILCYHRIAATEGLGITPPLNVTPTRFREQIAGLLAREYRFASLSSVLDQAERGEPIAPRTVVVTFDDGYGGVFSDAWPILRELGVPATVFLATAFIGSEEPFPFDPWGVGGRGWADPFLWRPLTWEQCVEMQASGSISFGTHTHTHANFRRRPDEFERDLSTSLDLLEQRLGHRPDLLSFPFGGIRRGFAGADLARVAERHGLRCGLTTEIELVDPRRSAFVWGRLEAADTDRSGTLAAKLEGWYEWMGRARELYRSVSR